MDNPWGCGISTGGGKKLCLCLFCIKAAESGWAAGKKSGTSPADGRTQNAGTPPPVQAGRRRRAQRVWETAPYRHPGPQERAATWGRPYKNEMRVRDGRVRTPAPTKFGESSGFSVGADDLGGPRAHSVRPYREKEARRECSLGEGIPRRFAAPPLTRGGLAGGGYLGGSFLL